MASHAPGLDTVKPDVHVQRFATRVLGRPVSDTDVVEVIVTAAQRLGRPAHRLDWAIWEAGRSTIAARAPARSTLPSEVAVADTREVPPARDEGPAESFVDDDDGYLGWVAAHPSGYVLNSGRNPSPRYLVLHRATCHTMVPRASSDTRTWTTAYRKTCALTAGELVAWAEAHGGGPPTACRVCRP